MQCRTQATIPFLVGAIGIIACTVFVVALPTILTEHAPTTVMATIALIDGLMHSPHATVTHAITPAATFFLLALPIALRVYDDLARLDFAYRLAEGTKRKL